MKLCSLSSGSSGNCVYLETRQSKILIDAGMSGKQVQMLLEMRGIHGSEIDAIFVTHEHSDHSKGVGVLSRRFHIPIYTNYGTFKAMEKTIGRIHKNYLKLFETNGFYHCRDFDFHPFAISHDAADPVGYVFMQDGQKVTVMTDTGVVSDQMIDTIKHSNLYYLEANHDVEMLRNGPYPFYLQERIRGPKGHLSNDDSLAMLRRILKGEKEIILLGHLSAENNRAELAQETVSRGLKETGMDVDRDLKILVSPRYVPTDLFEVIK